MRALFCLIAFALICGAFAQTNTTFCLSNGCSYADAVSATTITQASNKYTPPCIKVAMDTTVTFEMDFSFHPLRSGPVGKILSIEFFSIFCSRTTKIFNLYDPNLITSNSWWRCH
jgi:hypothetical protein